MGFFSNLIHLVFILIAIAICVCYIIVLCIPWYVYTVDYPLPSFLGTGQCTTTRLYYWFSLNENCLPTDCQQTGCVAGEQFPGFRTNSYCDNYGCPSSMAVYITSFVFTLIGLLCFVAATVIYALPHCGKKLSAYILAYVATGCLLLAILVMFALVAAAQNDAKPDPNPCPAEGPCVSWAGSKTYSGFGYDVTEKWGPAGGWIFAIIIVIASLIWAILACCCCAAAAEPSKDKEGKGHKHGKSEKA